MTTEEYWHGDPTLVKWYRKAHDLKREQKNQELWMQGLYIYNAFGAVLANAFGKKGSKKAKYIEKPIDITTKSEEEQQKEELRKQDAMIRSLTLLQQNWEKTHPKE